MIHCPARKSSHLERQKPFLMDLKTSVASATFKLSCIVVGSHVHKPSRFHVRVRRLRFCSDAQRVAGFFNGLESSVHKPRDVDHVFAHLGQASHQRICHSFSSGEKDE